MATARCFKPDLQPEELELAFSLFREAEEENLGLTPQIYDRILNILAVHR